MKNKKLLLLPAFILFLSSGVMAMNRTTSWTATLEPLAGADFSEHFEKVMRGEESDSSLGRFHTIIDDYVRAPNKNSARRILGEFLIDDKGDIKSRLIKATYLARRAKEAKTKKEIDILNVLIGVMSERIYNLSCEVVANRISDSDSDDDE
jgi:hypothetical protein